ncbi:MAG TPA: type I methionyl aminopeptidase [Syntrophaceae bacterium]|nr:type I methionyl aminopeptidase [Syntrophaceae bacterium]
MIILKSPSEIEKMRISNTIVAEILSEIKALIKPGVTTIELNERCEWLCHKKGAIPAFKGYRGYPCSLCTSVNEEVVHGIPSKRILKEGDIISLDFGVLYDGYFGDAAITVPVGVVSEKAALLIETTEQALYLGIEKAIHNNRISDISFAVQRHVESRGFSVVRKFVGHGIGKSLHEDPQIPNFGKPGQGPRLKPGMVLAIEPMVNAGRSEVEVLSDGWTAVTKDRSLSAHFEHCIAITENGAEILSKI